MSSPYLYAHKKNAYVQGVVRDIMLPCLRDSTKHPAHAKHIRVLRAKHNFISVLSWPNRKYHLLYVHFVHFLSQCTAWICGVGLTVALRFCVQYRYIHMFICSHFTSVIVLGNIYDATIDAVDADVEERARGQRELELVFAVKRRQLHLTHTHTFSHIHI